MRPTMEVETGQPVSRSGTTSCLPPASLSFGRRTAWVSSGLPWAAGPAPACGSGLPGHQARPLRATPPAVEGVPADAEVAAGEAGAVAVILVPLQHLPTPAWAPHIYPASCLTMVYGIYLDEYS